MDDTILKLVEADNRASEIVREAQQYREQITASMPEEKNKFKIEYKNRANERITEVREAEHSNFQKTVSFMKMTANERIHYLEKIFFERHVDLENELYERVIGQ